jgi:hypothetical protein
MAITWTARNHPFIYVLTLSDPVGDHVSGEFHRSDLQDQTHLPFLMARLCGVLLEKRSNKQLEKLMKLG